MKMTKVLSALLVAAVAMIAPAASAENFYLIAKEFDKVLPDSTVVKMWGFAEDPGGACYNVTVGGVNSTASRAARMASSACTGPVATSPGPRLEAPPLTGVGSNDRVRVRLVNLLDAANGGEPISLIVPGEPMPRRTTPGPTWTDGSVGPTAGGGPGVRRVRSFGRETRANGGRNSYNWVPSSGLIGEGTHLYHSGTHPQIQVQMGLYGAVTRNTTAGAPFDVYGNTFDNEVVVIYSEIDSAMHAAVSSGQYGTPAGPSSAFEYQPDYYLVNGQPFSTKAAATLPAGGVGDRTLVRLLNAGLQLHNPVLQGMRIQVLAEDSIAYPYPRDESSVVLPPLKAKDALLTPSADGLYALYDGMLNLTAPDGGSAGMLSFLQVGVGTPPPNTAPIAVDDPAVAGDYDTDQNNTLVVAAPGVLGNDSDPDGHPISAVLGTTNVTGGSLTLNADGSFTYVPGLNFNGTDTFTYVANDGVLDSPEATATITVNALANNLPVADDKSVTTGQQLAGGNNEAVAITLSGSDLDMNPLTFATTGVGPTGGVLTGTEPNLTYTPNTGFTGSDSFTYKSNDGTADSLVDAVVSITVVANQAPIANVDDASTPKNTQITFNIVANDDDPDPNGSIVATTVTITKSPRSGSLLNNGDGTVTYTPNFDYEGSDTFRYRVQDDDGELSVNPNGGSATRVRVNITP